MNYFKYSLSLLVLVLVSINSYSQSGDINISKQEGIIIDSISVNNLMDNALANISILIKNNKLKSRNILTAIPEITVDNRKQLLPSILITKKRSYVYDNSEPIPYRNAIRLTKKEGKVITNDDGNFRLRERFSFPLDSKFSLKLYLYLDRHTKHEVLSSYNIFESSPRPKKLVVIEDDIVPAPKDPIFEEPKEALIDILTKRYSFLQDFSSMNDDISSNRAGAYNVYFANRSYLVDDLFGENPTLLKGVIDAINIINAADDCRVTRVVLLGNSSPDGESQFNYKLSRSRANELKKYIVRLTNLKPTLIETHNGMIDYDGLYRLVGNSDMDDKSAVMDIIKNCPIWDPKQKVGRKGELMRLNKGDTYRYMEKHFFKKLRNVSVMVYYENIK